jgi:hypothetical protein
MRLFTTVDADFEHRVVVRLNGASALESGDAMSDIDN